jgi:hypothetical protein
MAKYRVKKENDGGRLPRRKWESGKSGKKGRVEEWKEEEGGGEPNWVNGEEG